MKVKNFRRNKPMKLNKKLLTAALAGALIVQAVPATTFAEKNSAENSYTEELNLTKQQAAARMDELAKEVAKLSKRRAEIVTKEWKPGETSEGLIEKLQREEAAAKKAYEAAKANFEAAAKAWEDAKDAQEKARLAKRKALDAYDAKLGEYDKLVKEAEAARDAAKKEAKEKYEDTIANANRKYEAAQTNLDRAENELTAAKKALETIADSDENVPEGTKAQYDQAKKAVTDAEAKVAQLKIERTKANDEKITVKDTAKENLEKANKQADTLFQAKLQELNKKYKLNDNYGDAAAELTLIERAKLKAIKDYDDAKANADAAFNNYVAANKAYEAASKAYAKANQRAYKVTEELKSIEKQLKEKYVRLNLVLKDQNKGINSLAGKLDADMIQEIENFAQLSKSEQAAAIAKLQKELNKLKEEYDKTKDEIKEVKSVYTYKFAVKDTAGKGVQGLSLTFTNIEDSTKVYVGTSDENGDIVVKGIAEGTYKIAVTHIPTGYKVVQKGKMVSEVKGLFRPEAEVKAENNVEEAKKDEAKKEAEVEIPEYVTIKGAEEGKKEEKENKDEKVIDGGTIVVEKEKDNKDNKDNKKPEKEEKENNKKPAKPSKKEKAELPKAGAAAEAATIAAAAMATMGGAYLSLKKRK